MTDKVRVRFAPSPTGFLHIGGLRTALYNELLAKQTGGSFILRIEDTDQTRLVEGGIENIVRTMKMMGLEANEGVYLDNKDQIAERGDYGPYLQTKRKDKHTAYAKQLIEMDKAYYCFCSAERLEDLRHEQQTAGKPTMYDGKCRATPREEAEKRIANGEKYVIRLKLPKQGRITAWDVIRDDISFDWSLIDDQIIIKSDGLPTYHLAATCDDHDMEITHVIRGEDWLPSLPKHLFIFESFGWTAPKYAHLPLLLNADHSKLSKRQNDVAVEDYLNKGYLPQAIINFVALLGWNPTGDRELYSHEELILMFDLAKVNKAGAVFNLEKLDWINEHYLRSIPEDEYLALTHPYIKDLNSDQNFVDRAALLVRDRVTLPSQVAELVSTILKETVDYSQANIAWKTQPKEQAVERLEAVKKLLSDIDESSFAKREARVEHEQRIKKMIMDKGWGNGDTLWPLRVALSGQDKSPSPFELLEVLGKERSLKRLEAAISHLST
ncbi:MAG: glutamate--tRNA ligase [Patescibacteria group bacterium]|nr:glutamate--tRNA ligase [Patescibacteria group bacterium]